MGIAKSFNHEQDVCEMHDSDKIACSAAGLLTRSKNEVSIIAGKEYQSKLTNCSLTNLLLLL